MVKDQSMRSFKGGSWDLRKDDRRRDQQTIGFPDRRQNNRRATSEEEALEAGGDLTWVSNTTRDD